MSRTKPHRPAHSRYVRGSQQRRKAAETQAAEQRATRRRRHVKLGKQLTLSAAAIGVFIAAAATDSAKFTWQTLLVAISSALVIITGFFMHGWLKKPLGRLTAILALSLASAVVLAGLAEAFPTCPGNTVHGRCTTGELANWALNGISLPIATAALIGLPFIIARFGISVPRRLHRISTTVTARVRGARPPFTSGPAAHEKPTRTRSRPGKSGAGRRAT